MRTRTIRTLIISFTTLLISVVAGFVVGNFLYFLYEENKELFLIHENTLRGDKRLY